MASSRLKSSKKGETNDDVPLSVESMNAEGLVRFMDALAGFIERHVRAIVNQVQGQSSSSGSTFFDFKKLDPPYFSGTLDPLEAEAWIRNIGKCFEVLNCTEEQKASFAAFMLNKEADHWWCMTKRFLEERSPEEQSPIVWSQFKEAFYKKYFPDIVREQLEWEFLSLQQGSMTVAQYESKFIELSRFALHLFPTEEKLAYKFQAGLKPYLKNKISILELKAFSEVVDRARIAERNNVELQQYGGQQKKRYRDDGAGVQGS